MGWFRIFLMDWKLEDFEGDWFAMSLQELGVEIWVRVKLNEVGRIGWVVDDLSGGWDGKRGINEVIRSMIMVRMVLELFGSVEIYKEQIV